MKSEYVSLEKSHLQDPYCYIKNINKNNLYE